MSLSRRRFLQTAAAAAATASSHHAFAWVPDSPRPQVIADAALAAAKAGGARYADVRLVRVRDESISTRDDHVTGVHASDSFGLGVRVLKNGAWGFAAVPVVSTAGAQHAAQRALAIAEANATLLTRPIELAPEPVRSDAWQTPLEKDPFRVPLDKKSGLLLEAAKAALAVPNIKAVEGGYAAFCQEKSFFSSEGARLEQMIYRIRGGYTITAVDSKRGQFETRRHLLPPRAAGFEHLERGGLVEDAPQLAKEAVDKLAADPPAEGPTDLILDSSNLWLTIHESIGHSTELDRVLGYEANLAGTSFAHADDLGKLRYGPPMMHVYADKTTPGGMATCAWDDDGCATRQWDLIKDGVLVGFQTERDQAGLPGFAATGNTACAYADSWASFPFQRMPNVSLAPGEKPLSLEQLVASTEKGILVMGNGSWSIDHQRRNFQFGGDSFWQIEQGKRVRPLRNLAYQGNTLQFWSSLDAICDASEWRLHGALNDGKGQPEQSNAVSHGCSPARFRQVRVLDVSRGAA